MIDTEERVIRYIELNADGLPFHENLHTGVSLRADGSSQSEEDWFVGMQEAATAHGTSIVRLCNHVDRSCDNPDLGEIESDGDGGLRAKPEFPHALRNIEFWHPDMERAFIVVTDERGEEPVQRMVRFEPGQWDDDLKQSDLHIPPGSNSVRVRSVPAD